MGDQLVAETSTWQHTQHSQQENVCSPDRIRTHNLSRRAVAELRLRPLGPWDRHPTLLVFLYVNHHSVSYLCWSVINWVTMRKQRIYYDPPATRTDELWFGSCNVQHISFFSKMSRRALEATYPGIGSKQDRLRTWSTTSTMCWATLEACHMLS